MPIKFNLSKNLPIYFFSFTFSTNHKLRTKIKILLKLGQLVGTGNSCTRITYLSTVS